jgi:GTPase SAR1 family protein
MYCMEFLEENLEDWLAEELDVRASPPSLAPCIPEAARYLRSAVAQAHELHWCVQAYGEEDYLIFDCPGQIELYSHMSMFKNFVKCDTPPSAGPLHTYTGK